MSGHIFLSYARRDGKDAAALLRENLRTAASATWLDVKDIPAGAEWRREVQNAISDADAVVWLLTPLAAESLHVREEIELARAAEKRVIPLLIGVDRLPDFARDLEYIKADIGSAEGFAKLIGGLQDIWTRVRTKLEAARFEADPQFRGLIEQLTEYLAPHYARAPMRPELFLVFVEAIKRLSADVRKGQNFELALFEFAAGLYSTAGWDHAKAYAANREKVEILLTKYIDKNKLPKVKVVPVVLIVMTAPEADALENGSAFAESDDALREHFETVSSMLEKEGVKDWAERYGAQSEDWQPFAAGDGGTPLRRLLQLELDGWRAEKNYEPILKVSFVDVRTINEPANRSMLRKLQTEGCVVLVDFVSMCHPVLFEQYRRSLLDVFPSTLLTKIAPFEPVPVSDHAFTVRLPQVVDSFFYERYRIDRDPRCARAGTDFEFKLWIRDKLATYVTDHVQATEIRQYYLRPR